MTDKSHPVCPRCNLQHASDAPTCSEPARAAPEQNIIPFRRPSRDTTETPPPRYDPDGPSAA